MVIAITSSNKSCYQAAIAAMHVARKDVFIDRLRWPLTAAETGEFDQFDDDHATYLIAYGEDGSHLGSMRLLPTTRPHLLDTVFPQLCEGPVPKGRDTFEITRLCLSPHIRATRRRRVRDLLVTALVEYALLCGISRYTCLCELPFISQIVAMGWDYVPLGLPKTIGGATLAALELRVNPATLRLFADQWKCPLPVLQVGSALAVAA